MSQTAKLKDEPATQALVKVDPSNPALIVVDRHCVAIRAGTVFDGRRFDVDMPLVLKDPVVGADYGIVVGRDTVELAPLSEAPTSDFVLGGFHFAAGGNATARIGGDNIPAINPCSLWDQNFRPSCADPRGMALITMPGHKFWADIYLTASDHLDGTSRFGVTIADGDDPPQKVSGKGHFKWFDYETALAVMAHHGKGVMSPEEFFAAAYGVAERTAIDSDPKITGLDAPRTSRFGLMQVTGNLWQWGHDGDPDNLRASLFGGSWWHGGFAGSRYAHVAFAFPGNSIDNIGARGRGDHLELA